MHKPHPLHINCEYSKQNGAQHNNLQLKGTAELDCDELERGIYGGKA